MMADCEGDAFLAEVNLREEVPALPTANMLLEPQPSTSTSVGAAVPMMIREDSETVYSSSATDTCDTDDDEDKYDFVAATNECKCSLTKLYSCHIKACIYVYFIIKK